MGREPQQWPQNRSFFGQNHNCAAFGSFVNFGLWSGQHATPARRVTGSISLHQPRAVLTQRLYRRVYALGRPVAL